MPRKTRLPAGVVRMATRAASMRPRPDAAENPACRGAAATVTPCFNEAAARCRGKQTTGRRGRPARRALQ